MSLTQERTRFSDFDEDEVESRTSVRPVTFSIGGSLGRPGDLEQPNTRDLYESATLQNREESEYDPDEWEITVYPMREFVFHLCCFERPLRFNPLTSAIGVGLLWGISLWCIVDPTGSLAEVLLWRSKSTEYFTWFYIGTRPLFLFFVIWLTYKYGHIRLGEANSVPEYSNITYVAMLFSAGVAVGIFYFAVSEPLWHQTSNWYAKSGYHSQGEEENVKPSNISYSHQ